MLLFFDLRVLFLKSDVLVEVPHYGDDRQAHLKYFLIA